jgi:hypothetical protein
LPRAIHVSTSASRSVSPNEVSSLTGLCFPRPGASSPDRDMKMV